MKPGIPMPGPGAVEAALQRGQIDVVVQVLNAGLSPHEAARRHGLEAAEIEAWCERFVLTAADVLRQTPATEPSERDARIRRLRGELADLIADPAQPRVAPRSRSRPSEESPWSVECL
jgi:hypothetical protein